MKLRLFVFLLKYKQPLEQQGDKELLKKTSSYNIFGSDPDTIRTCDPQLRRLLLYPLSYGAFFDKEHTKKLKIGKISYSFIISKKVLQI